MSTYKKLNRQDAYITTYAAHKSWVVYGNQFDSYGITRQTAGSGYTIPSLQQLYYKTKNSDGTIPSHSFDLYNQSTLFFSSSRNLTTGSQIFSIPRQLYGTSIKPGTFALTIPAAAVEIALPIQRGYVAEGYVDDTPTVYITGPDNIELALKPPPGLPQSITTTYRFLDDAEGNLYLSGSSLTKVGDVIYPHGMAIITNENYWSLINGALLAGQSNVTMSFENTHPIFTHNYHCKLRESEYNFTYNPSALSSSLKTVYNSNGDLYSTSSAVSDGVIKSNLTGSAFQPYITTVGLYNDANELIAVGKMTRPVPKSANTEMTIIVKIDI